MLLKLLFDLSPAIAGRIYFDKPTALNVSEILHQLKSYSVLRRYVSTISME
jgi:hypothetical protein